MVLDFWGHVDIFRQKLGRRGITANLHIHVFTLIMLHAPPQIFFDGFVQIPINQKYLRKACFGVHKLPLNLILSLCLRFHPFGHRRLSADAFKF